mmetsp:Transcript_171092/g.548289  ORF Transcript_171092/g.548289 Transcript_171092/m.548289 type:complete len:357 (+) Transcript_171092:210-1280(+)
MLCCFGLPIANDESLFSHCAAADHVDAACRGCALVVLGAVCHDYQHGPARGHLVRADGSSLRAAVQNGATKTFPPHERADATGHVLAGRCSLCRRSLPSGRDAQVLSLHRHRRFLGRIRSAHLVGVAELVGRNGCLDAHSQNVCLRRRLGALGCLGPVAARLLVRRCRRGVPGSAHLRYTDAAGCLCEHLCGGQVWQLGHVSAARLVPQLPRAGGVVGTVRRIQRGRGGLRAEQGFFSRAHRLLRHHHDGFLEHQHLGDQEAGAAAARHQAVRRAGGDPELGRDELAARRTGLSCLHAVVQDPNDDEGSEGRGSLALVQSRHAVLDFFGFAPCDYPNCSTLSFRWHCYPSGERPHH